MSIFTNIMNKKALRRCSKISVEGYKALYAKNNLSRKAAESVLAGKGLANLPQEEKDRIFADMTDCFKKWRLGFDEYFKLHFDEKSEQERAAICEVFGTDYNRYLVTIKVNSPENERLFDIKSETAEKFAKYYKRPFKTAALPYQKRVLVKFLKAHKGMVVKPIVGSLGDGVVAIKYDPQIGARRQVNRFVKELCSPSAEAPIGKTALLKRLVARLGLRRFLSYYWVRGVIVETLIDQDPRMAKFHPSSVNTVRMTTWRLDDRTIVFHPTFRMGVGNSFVDNAGAGGVLCAVDAATGKIIAAGNKFGQKFERHPDTNEQLIGATIPEWDKAVALVKELAQVVPDNRYTGWDLALTKDGWALVEANCRGQWGAQALTGEGFKQEVDGYLKELGIQHEW